MEHTGCQVSSSLHGSPKTKNVGYSFPFLSSSIFQNWEGGLFLSFPFPFFQHFPKLRRWVIPFLSFPFPFLQHFPKLRRWVVHFLSSSFLPAFPKTIRRWVIPFLFLASSIPPWPVARGGSPQHWRPWSTSHPQHVQPAGWPSPLPRTNQPSPPLSRLFLFLFRSSSPSSLLVFLETACCCHWQFVEHAWCFFYEVGSRLLHANPPLKKARSLAPIVLSLSFLAPSSCPSICVHCIACNNKKLTPLLLSSDPYISYINVINFFSLTSHACAVRLMCSTHKPPHEVWWDEMRWDCDFIHLFASQPHMLPSFCSCHDASSTFFIFLFFMAVFGLRFFCGFSGYNWKASGIGLQTARRLVSHCVCAVIREILGINNRVEILVFCKSNRLHVDIFRLSCIELGYIL